MADDSGADDSGADDKGPDFAQGVPVADIPENGVLGVALGGEPWMLAKVGGEVVALSAACTHWQGPLAEGLRHADTVRCPWHHACFSLKTGLALEAPAFDPLARRAVQVRDGRAFPGEPLASAQAQPEAPAAARGKRIVVIGAGAAGFAAVERLKTLGHVGALAWLDADPGAPVDRPNLSKEYLSGEAPAEYLALQAPGTTGLTPRKVAVQSLDLPARAVVLEGGERLAFDALLVAPGAEPRRPDTPGFDRPEVHVLRSRADAERLVAAAGKAKRVAVVGAGFIGLEAAASLKQRGLEVTVVAPEALPLASRIGDDLGRWIKALQETNGVTLKLGRKATAWDGAALTLDNGSTVQADLVLVGLGVAPRLDLFAAAGIEADKGVPVDAAFRVQGAEGVWACGDVAAFPDALTGEPIRVEHWTCAERQGQTAGASMLGLDARWAEPPYFWTMQFGESLSYVGHADAWDETQVDGSIEAGDAEVRLLKSGQVRAVITLGRDAAALAWAQRFRDEAAKGRAA